MAQKKKKKRDPEAIEAALIGGAATAYLFRYPLQSGGRKLQSGGRKFANYNAPHRARVSSRKWGRFAKTGSYEHTTSHTFTGSNGIIDFANTARKSEGKPRIPNPPMTIHDVYTRKITHGRGSKTGVHTTFTADTYPSVLGGNTLSSIKHTHISYNPKKIALVGGAAVAAGAAGYGGYRLYKHFHQNTQSKSFYYREVRGKRQRVKNTRGRK